MTKRPPIPIDAYRLPKSLLRDGWWLVERREAVVIPFPRRNRRPPLNRRTTIDKEKES